MKAGRGRPKGSTKDKLAVKKDKPVKGPAKRGPAGKDPNKPKRPASAFFVFMEEFRKTYKEAHPKEKSVSAVGKASGQKWKSLSDADKAPYVAKANKRKAEYEKNMAAYNKKQSDDRKKSTPVGDEDESDKSKSEINDEDEEEEGSGEDDEGDDE